MSKERCRYLPYCKKGVFCDDSHPTPCKFFLEGRCLKGNFCNFNHGVIEKPKEKKDEKKEEKKKNSITKQVSIPAQIEEIKIRTYEDILTGLDKKTLKFLKEMVWIIVHSDYFNKLNYYPNIQIKEEFLDREIREKEEEYKKYESHSCNCRGRGMVCVAEATMWCKKHTIQQQINVLNNKRQSYITEHQEEKSCVEHIKELVDIVRIYGLTNDILKMDKYFRNEKDNKLLSKIESLIIANEKTELQRVTLMREATEGKLIKDLQNIVANYICEPNGETGPEESINDHYERAKQLKLFTLHIRHGWAYHNIKKGSPKPHTMYNNWVKDWLREKEAGRIR